MKKNKSDTPVQLISISEAAKILQCHPNTLRLWDKDGTLKAIRFGRKTRRYKKEDILKMINQNHISNKQLLSGNVIRPQEDVKTTIGYQDLPQQLANLRKSGIDIIGNIPWGTHFCQFYRTKEDLLDILIPYFTAGLENNEFCMWVTSKPLEVQEAKAALEKKIPRLEYYLKKGQIEILDYSLWYTKGGKFKSENVLNGWVSKLNIALSKGFDGLRLTGNTFWLEKTDWKAFSGYEEAVNNVISKYKMLAVCTYSLEKCGANEILDVIANHQFAIIKRSDKWTAIESSEQKKNRIALMESEQRFATTLSSIGDAVISTDTSGKITFMNPVAEKLTGWTSRKATGKLLRDVFKIINQHTRKEVENPVTKVLKKNRVINLANHTILVRKDKTEIHIDDSGAPIKDTNGKTIGVVLVFRDITERTKADEMLDIEHGKLEAIIENIGTGVVITNGSGKILSMNTAALKLHGFKSNKEMYSKINQYANGFELYYPDGKDMPLKDWPLSRAIRGEFIRDYEVKLKNKKRNLSTIWNYTVTPVKNNKGDISLIVINIQDITERKKAELELRKMYRVIEQSPTSIVITDTNGTIEYVNPKFCRLTGYSFEEAIGQNPRILKSGYMGHKEYAKLWKTITSGHEWKGELLNKKKNGELYWELGLISPVKDNKGRITHFLAVKEDITERKKAEDALRDSESQLKSAQRIAKTGSWELDLKTNSLTWSEEVFRIFETDNNQTTPSYEEFLDLIHPEDRKIVDKAFTDSIKMKTPYDIAHRIKLPDSSIKYVREICETYYDKKGKPVKSVGSIQDITEQKNIEKKLNRLASFPRLNPNPIIEINMQGKVVYANPVMLKLFPDIEAIGMKHSILSGLDPKEIKKDKKLLRRETQAEDKWFYQSMTYIPETDSIRIYNIDITTRKILEQQKDEFVSIASHELKTPITSIKAFGQILRHRFNKSGDKDSEKLLDRMDIQVNKLVSLVSDLLDVTKIQANKLTFNKEYFDVDKYIEENVFDVQSALSAYGYKHIIHPKGKAGHIFYGDKFRLGQVLSNLILNAAKYSPEADKIIISVVKNNREVTIKVKDYGIGIPKEKTRYLFQKFYQAHPINGEKNRFSSLGLGLYIASEIVKQHNGNIGVRSKEGNGSTFYFTLPLKSKKQPTL